MSFPYLGRKISLISKSEIRYEGVLYAVDAKESTLALARVRSFGTEGRVADCPVAPKDEVYEYIIFKGSDIKDLDVCEPVKPAAVVTSSLYNDPAIVQHSAPLSTCSLPYGKPTCSHTCGIHYQQYPSQIYQHLPTLFSNAGSRSSSSQQSSTNKGSTMDASVQVSGSGDYFDSKSNTGNIPLKSSLRSSSQNEYGDQRRGGGQFRFQRNRGGRRGGRGRGRGNFNQRNEVLKFDGEYDFEQANEEFKQLEEKMSDVKLESTEPEVISPVGDTEDLTAYDKEKSFFDDISCEASRLAKGIPRFDWRIERKLNVETFGVSRSNSSWFRRWRGRGFRRGMPRGRMALPATDSPKSVTFGSSEIVTVDTNSEQQLVEIMKEEIPVIELIEETVREWKEGSTEDAKDEWKLQTPLEA